MPATRSRCVTTGGLALALALAAPVTSAAAKEGSDPAGNNGTVKVDGVPFDGSRGHEPHVGCELSLDFWGFDVDDTASITVTGIAPTGGGLLHTESGTLVSDDAAGGGQDLDESVVLGVDRELSELQAVSPHPQQGWHVKIAVDVDSAPGGAKQKTAWLECPSLPGVGSAGADSPQGEGTADAPAAVPTSAPTASAPAPAVPTPSAPAAETPQEVTLGAAAVEPLAAPVEQTRAAVVPAAAPSTAVGSLGGGGVRAQGAVTPQALPFTGTGAVAGLVALGVGSLLAGGLAHRLGRRRPATA